MLNQFLKSPQKTTPHSQMSRHLAYLKICVIIVYKIFLLPALQDNKNVCHTNSYLKDMLYHYELYFKCSQSSKNTVLDKMYCMAVTATNAL